MKPIQRSEVVGSPIRCIRQEQRMKGIDGWLDVGLTYFTLESGISFVIPGSGSEAFESVDVPRKARDVRPPNEGQVIGHHVVEAYRRLYKGEDSGDKAVLRLSSGVFLTETIVAPHGTGAVGLYVYSPTEWEALNHEEDHDFDLVSFWAEKPDSR